MKQFFEQADIPKSARWLFTVAKKLKDWREIEAGTIESVAILEAKVEQTRARSIGGAYADGVVDGKNKETRDAQEAGALAQDAIYQQLYNDYLKEKAGLGSAGASRKYYEDLLRIGLALIGSYK